MTRLILIDGNNWGFAGMQSPVLSSGQKDTQAILAVLKKVRNVFLDHPDATITVLWDGRSWRKDLYKEYKANRSKTEKQVTAVNAYVEQKKDIVKGLRLLGVRQLSADNWEADDLAYIFTRNAVEKGIPVTLLTADCDWQQLVQKGVDWRDNIHNKTCRIETFKEVTGFSTPAQFIEAKCVLGDTGDNVKGIMGIGPKALEGIYADYSSFEGFLAVMEVDRETHIERWKTTHNKVMPKALRELDITEARKTMALNRTLMELSTNNRPKAINLRNDRKAVDVEAFEEFCHENAFMSINHSLFKFVQPFKDNFNVRNG